MKPTLAGRLATPVRQVAEVARVIGLVLQNPDLRRQQLAFAGFNAGEWGVWIAMLVYAYDHGGATAAALAAVVQLVPSAIFAPFAAALADRHPPARVLTLGYVAQAASLAGTAALLFAGAPPPLAYAGGAVASCATSITRPAQAVLVPSLVRSLDQLTATNVVSGWTESASLLVAPALAGGLLALSGPGLVFAAMAVVTLASAACVNRIDGPPAAAGGEDAQGSLAHAAEGFRLVARDPSAGVLIAVLGGQFLLIGGLDVLFVVLAVDVLGLGGSGAGYLNAAFGAGGVLGIAATVGLVGKRRLGPPLVQAALIWTAAMLALGLFPTVFGAFLLLAVCGAARGLLDVTARTLLQRTARNDVLARVFGVLETLDAIGLALGAVLAPVLVALLGPRAAVAGLALVLPLLLGLAWRRIRAIDSHADVPVVEIALLRSLPIFRSLEAPTLEALARGLTPVEVRPGEDIIREGSPGERFYVVADGELEVTRGSKWVATVERGAGVGEIALLEDVPRTASVTARTMARLYAIDAAPFLDVVSRRPRRSWVFTKEAAADPTVALRPFFHGLAPHELERIRACTTERIVEPGDVIVGQWDLSKDFFVLVEGGADVEVDGERVAHVGEGEFIGELAALDLAAGFGYSRTATVRATERSRLLVMTGEELCSIMSELPVVESRIRAAVEQRLPTRSE